MRAAGACLLALSALALLGSSESAHADDLVHVTANVNYDVRAEEGDVFVTWDVSAANNGPDSFIFSIPVPVLAGATEVSAQEPDGTPLATSIEPTEVDWLDILAVSFAEDIFFGDEYDFRLTYVLSETRQGVLLVTPFYVFVPMVAAGDEATVTTTTPGGTPWSVSLEPGECEQLAEGLACSGSETVYVAGLLEVRQPDATQLDSFSVAVDGADVSVSLTYFQSEDAIAAHQREVIEQTLPLFAEAYGFPYPGPAAVSVAHSGRQSVLGYEGLTECAQDFCSILISPGARDYTLAHELAHLWSGIFAERWLSEGFADWATTQVIDRAPDGLLTGDLTPTVRATVPLQLDDWEYEGSAIGASAEELERSAAGYDYSLRFVRTLASEVGAETLGKVNRTLAESGEPADSRRYMDLLEEASGGNLDSLFLLWVFPESSRAIVKERRVARDRFDAVAARLAEEGLAEEALQAAREAIADWRFSAALGELDAVEANIGRFLEVQSELQDLEEDARTLGLELPQSFAAAVSGGDLDAADDQIAAARAALGAYGVASERLAEPRNVWQRFGLLFDDPDDELAKAREAFESGRFERVRDHAAAAIETVDDASRSAMLRLLVVAGGFSAFAGGIGVAYWVALLRRRRLTEP